MAATIFSTQQPKSRKRIGPNKVTNGSFAADTNWTKQAGWTISGGKANFSATGVTAYLRQNIGIVQGRTYEITFTLEVSAGD